VTGLFQTPQRHSIGGLALVWSRCLRWSITVRSWSGNQHAFDRPSCRCWRLKIHLSWSVRSLSSKLPPAYLRWFMKWDQAFVR